MTRFLMIFFPSSDAISEYQKHPEVGETVAMVKDWGDVLKKPGLGLYGAIVVGAAGTLYSDPVTGADMSRRSAWFGIDKPPTGLAYRDSTLFLQDEDPALGTAVMPYAKEVHGVVGLDYRVAGVQSASAQGDRPFLRRRVGAQTIEATKCQLVSPHETPRFIRAGTISSK